MIHPERFSRLPVATWPRLRALLDHRQAGGDVIHMTIGDPRHDMPDFVAPLLAQHCQGFRSYPNNNGTPDLLDAITGWLQRRYHVDMEHENILALNGTREGLYHAAAALSADTKHGKRPLVLSPNPFYPAYSAAAAAIDADIAFLPTGPQTGYLPDFTALSVEDLNRTTLAYMCSPSNPQGAVADESYWREIITLAERYDFQILADECYSEIYRTTPPVGALEVAQSMGADPERVMVFHSLSKRSNLAGLRSGFCAGGKASIARMRQLRAYGGTPLPTPIQVVSAAAWSDETHVDQSRALYQKKYALADDILGNVPKYYSPQAGFFLWLNVANGETAAVKLYEATGVRVLPGAYLSREYNGENPGTSFIRVALVASYDEVRDGLTRLKTCLFE